MPRATRSKNLNTSDSWTDGSTFLFEKAEQRKGRRETLGPKKINDAKLKNKRKSTMLKRLELPEDSVASPSLTRKTRRQSMVALRKESESKIPRSTSERLVKKSSKSSLVQTKAEAQKVKTVSRSKPPVGKPEIKSRKSVAKIETQKKSPVKSISAKSCSKPPIGKAETKQKKSVVKTEDSKKSPGKTTDKGSRKGVQKPKKAKTPVSKPPSSVKAKKEVSQRPSPVLKNLITSGKKSSKKLSQTPQVLSLDDSYEELFTGPVEPKPKKARSTFISTPRHEDPSNLLRQSWRKKASTEIRQFRMDKSPDSLKSSPKVEPSTPVSSSNLPPTPKSSHSPVYRRSFSTKRKNFNMYGNDVSDCGHSPTNSGSIRNLSRMLEDTGSKGMDDTTLQESTINTSVDEEKTKSRCLLM